MVKRGTSTKHPWEIEDGFALKRQRDEALKKGKKSKKPDGDCVIPPPPATHILSSFVLSNPRSRKAIKDYVNIQAREKVLHAENVKTEHAVGRDYDVWDVHTNQDRYWVITNPTNLYSQYYFPSMDYTLSFHIGVSARMMSLNRGAPDRTHKSRFTPAWRRWDEAAETYDNAEEAEDYQAVGMKCRESLIQFVRSLAMPEMVPTGQEVPKKSDVVGWSELIANHISPGESNSYVRSHLKGIAKTAWGLANWLTHFSGATRTDASFVLDATHGMMDAFGGAVIRFESHAPERCPKCQSYAIEVEFDSEMFEDDPYFSECAKCGWKSSEEHSSS